MDAKITKTRLGHLLSYDWLKIVGLALAIIMLWVLVFTTTATRILPSQTFTVCNYVGNHSVKSKLLESLSDAYSTNAFTHEVLKTDIVDLNVEQSMAYQLLEARVATDELDVMFVSQEDDASTAYEETDSAGNKTTAYKSTYLESFLNGYHYDVFKIDEYLAQMQAYVEKYYENGEIDEEKVETDFRARVKRMKDKRYKTEEQIKKGLVGEIERIEKYQKALTDFNAYLAAGYVEIVEVSHEKEEGNDYDFSWSGKYGINLCPDVEKMGKLADYVSYAETYLDEEGVEKTKPYAEDMTVCIFNSNGEEECYRYEALVYITNLVELVKA